MVTPFNNDTLRRKCIISIVMNRSFLLLAAERSSQTAKAKPIEKAVETQGAEEAIDNLAKTKAVQKATDEVEDTGQKQTDGCQNLEQRLSEQTPHRVKLRLGVRHVLDLALRTLDRLGDSSSQLRQRVNAYLLEDLGQVMLLWSGLTSLRLGLGILLDATIRVQGANAAVQFGQDLATLFDERLDVLDELLLVALLLGLALSRLNLLRNHLADGAEAIKSLLDKATNTFGEFIVSLGLLTSLFLLFRLNLLLFLLLGLGNVLEQGNVSDNTVLGVDHVVIAVNLLAGADGHLTRGKLADDVSVFINNLTLAVDAASLHGTLLLRKRDVSHNTVLGVDDIVVLVDLLTSTDANVTGRELADQLARVADDLALLVDSLAFHGALGLRNILEQLDVANNASLGVDNIIILVDDLAGACLDLARGELANNITVSVDDFTAAVDLSAFHGSLLPLGCGFGLPALRLAEEVAVTVKYVTVLVDGASKKALRITLDKAPNNVAGRSDNGTILGDSATRKLRERSLLGAFTIALRDELSAADNVTRLAADVTLLVAHAADQLLDVALDNAAIDGTVLVNDIASFVDALASKSRVIDNNRCLGFGFGLRLGLPTLSFANGIAALVENVTLVVNLFALELLRITLDDTSDNVSVVDDMAVGFDGSTREVFEGSGFGEFFTLSLGDGLGLSNDLTCIIPNLAALVSLTADKMLQDPGNDATNSLALVVDEVASLVDLGALQDGEVDCVLEKLVGNLGLELGLADDAATLVDNIALSINSHANEVCRITFSNAADRGIIEDDLALIVNFGTGELLKGLEKLVTCDSDGTLILGNCGADGAQNALDVVLDRGFGGGVGSRGNVNVGDVTCLCVLGRSLGRVLSTLNRIFGTLRLGELPSLSVLGDLGLVRRVLLVGPILCGSVLGGFSARHGLLALLAFFGDSGAQIGGKLRLSIKWNLGNRNVGCLKVLGKLALQVVRDLRNGNVEGSNFVRNCASLLRGIILDGLGTLSLLVNGFSIHLFRVVDLKEVLLGVLGHGSLVASLGLLLGKQLCKLLVLVGNRLVALQRLIASENTERAATLALAENTSEKASKRVLSRFALLRLATAKGTSNTAEEATLGSLLVLTTTKNAAENAALSLAQADAPCQVTDKRKGLADDAAVFADDVTSRRDNVADKFSGLTFCDFADGLASLVYHLTGLADDAGDEVFAMVMNVLFNRTLKQRRP
ncbi:hypothetical protein CTA1_6122 [Colletotrichum tanaceti]|uniref:Uncharacterized protein n=1 Tax=Colletotrichum tanaceti TaxID=1306861 RepID=A0A4U6X3Y9_9PEZI|nr:hypothetical protein CTA1_6122 [Colletotrichum tanaceti]